MITNHSQHRIESIITNDVLATSISKWTAKPDDVSTVLNEGQIKAMKLVGKRYFQLIQGPPGEKLSELVIVA